MNIIKNFFQKPDLKKIFFEKIQNNLKTKRRKNVKYRKIRRDVK